MMMPDPRPYIIRPYQDADREGLLKIAADTAYFGEPLEAFLDDRRLFNDIFYRYYVELEPQHAWVAIAGGEVAGFLTGCTDTSLQRRRWAYIILPQFLWRACRGKYQIGAKTWRYLRKLMGVAVHHEHAQVDEHIYPAHLHINVSREWRGMGMGKNLMQVFLDQLRQEHIQGVHLMTTSMNKAAIKLYESQGFSLLDSRRTHAWDDMLEHPVDNLCYGLKFH
jgi:ribosomal protein S18 acetylase RimI-like enzyme